MRKSPYAEITDYEWDHAAHMIIEEYFDRNKEECPEPESHVIFEMVYWLRERAREDRLAADFDAGFKGITREDG